MDRPLRRPRLIVALLAVYWLHTSPLHAQSSAALASWLPLLAEQSSDVMQQPAGIAPLVERARVVVGAERLDTLVPQLDKRQVGLVVNHSSRVGPRHLIDTLLGRGVCVARIFAPEHGYRGQAEAGELVDNGQDARTGVPIVSLYGRAKKPRPEDLEGIDVVVFDIQDVGARFYTYISTLFYVLEACAENNVPVIVLDRPNPNGHIVDGPVLDMRLASFLGIAPLPIAHGCTVGELARMFAGEYWIRKGDRLDLTVITCRNYTHRTPYMPPVKPSPNLPDLRSILLYPSVCLFEGTVASVGRGTAMPFQFIGHPAFPDSSFYFVPRPNAGSSQPPFQFQACYGLDLSAVPLDSLQCSSRLELDWLLEFYWKYPDKENFFQANNFFDLLAGTSNLRQLIVEGCSEEEIRATWEWDLQYYRKIRKQYLLYPE
jgi:uncharacterized protein YbbC (DUF1343 family)